MRGAHQGRGAHLGVGIAAAMLALAGCGGGGTGGSGSGEGTAGTGTGTSGTSGGESSDVSALLVDVVAPRICGQLAGSFVGLPGEGGHSGPESGTDPTVGRWWIRQCTAHAHDGVLDLSISGTGWTWVDRESMGFAVQQYLRFDADAAFTASMEVGYDREHGIVTIWMRPTPETVQAHVTPRGMVEARATGMLSGMLGGILELTGSSASDRARQQVAEEGGTRLRERFSAGFTVTYATATEQMDFMVGALDRGQTPMRPYPQETGLVWSVNQRLAVWPGGIDVLGPIDPTQGAQVIDFELEQGEGLHIDAVCLADFERFYDSLLQGATATPPTGHRVMEVPAVGTTARYAVPALGCPTLLLIAPRDGATLPVQARARVCPGTIEATATASSGTATIGATSSTTTAAHATTTTGQPVRIQIAGLSVSQTAPNGSRWDMLGGEPDPYIIVASVPGHREIERTTASTDTHEVTLDHWLPGAYHPEDLPIHFTVYDDDVTGDELIGQADLTAEQAAGHGDVRLELRTTGDVPQAAGYLRLHIEAVH